MADQITVTITTPVTDAGNFRVMESTNYIAPELTQIGTDKTLAEMQAGQTFNIADNTRLITVRNLADQPYGCTAASSSQRLPLVYLSRATTELAFTNVTIYEVGKTYTLNSNFPGAGSSTFIHPSVSADYDSNGGYPVGVDVTAACSSNGTNCYIRATDTNGETWCTYSANVPSGSNRTLHVSYSPTTMKIQTLGTYAYLHIEVSPYSSSCDHGSGD